MDSFRSYEVLLSTFCWFCARGSFLMVLGRPYAVARDWTRVSLVPELLYCLPDPEAFFFFFRILLVFKNTVLILGWSNICRQLRFYSQHLMLPEHCWVWLQTLNTYINIHCSKSENRKKDLCVLRNRPCLERKGFNDLSHSNVGSKDTKQGSN